MADALMTLHVGRGDCPDARRGVREPVTGKLPATSFPENDGPKSVHCPALRTPGADGSRQSARERSPIPQAQ